MNFNDYNWYDDFSCDIMSEFHIFRRVYVIYKRGLYGGYKG